jgi:hypothetical protein
LADVFETFLCLKMKHKDSTQKSEGSGTWLYVSDYDSPQAPPVLGECNSQACRMHHSKYQSRKCTIEIFVSSPNVVSGTTMDLGLFWLQKFNNGSTSLIKYLSRKVLCPIVFLCTTNSFQRSGSLMPSGGDTLCTSHIN